jgi:hypothetical protein
MKKQVSLFISILALACFTARAQNKEYRIKLSASSGQKVVITNVFGTLHITGGTSDDLVITGTPEKAPPEKAKGLRVVSAYGEDNTGIGLNVTQLNGATQIAGVSKASNEETFTIQVPKAVNLKVESEYVNAQDVSIENLSGEIEAKVNFADLSVKNVSGPIVLYTLNGKIEVTLVALAQTKPSSINSVNGSIDLTLPANSPANFDLSTINGEVYSDLDLKFESAEAKDMRRVAGGMKTAAKNAGGGVGVTISSVNDNIYLRRTK